MELFNTQILLNSRSPRRREILEKMNLNVKTVSTVCEESFPCGLSCNQAALFIAGKKDDAYTKELSGNEILLSADTVVIADNTIFGKPKNVEDAKIMLKKLSGKEHKVITGCVLRSKYEKKLFSEETKVFFKPLSGKEIDYYVNNFKPLDKAGAYGIQEWIGMIGINKIEGDFYNVMGLPSAKVFETLKDMIQ